MARLPSRFFTGHVLEQVTEGEAVLVTVVAPLRAGSAAGAAHHVVVHDGPGVAAAGEAGDLEPGGPAPLVTCRRIELGVGDPGGGDVLSEPELGLAVSMKGARSAVPPPRAAGLTQATCWPAVAVWPD